MNPAERNRGLVYRSFLRADCDSAFSSVRDKFLSSVWHLLRLAVGFAAFSALAACGYSSSSETVNTGLAGVASVSNGKPAVTLVAEKTSVPMQTPGTLQWNAQDAQTCVASGGWTGPQPTSGTATTNPLNATTNFTLTCDGAGGSATQSVEIAVTGAPTVKLGATPATVAAGGASSLSWSAENATTCTASGAWQGTMATTGTTSTGALSKTTEYELTCTGAGGSATQSATVTVSALAPSVTLSAAPSTVNSGSASTLTWSSANATACAASGAWSGNKPLSGSQSSGAVTASATYTLTCSGSGGSATQSVTVSVKGAAPSVSLSANPSTVASGLNSTVSWNAVNATSCSASGAWAGAKPVSGSQSTGALSSSSTYMLTCSGPDGSAAQSATVSVKASTPTVSLSVGPSSVASGGSATLNWSATNATSCSASGSWSGAKPARGSQSTGALTADATYVLTCSSAGGSATQSATVSVTKPAPTVSLSASPSSVISGNSSTLTWAASNATSCTASGAWSGSRPVSGSQPTGALSSNATYTLRCTGSGGTATQSATVTVSSKPTATVSISATPSTVKSGGNSSLTWSSANATSCVASGAWAGAKALSGSQSTGALTANTTYSITCTGTGGSATQSITVSVTSPAPTVSFSASPSTVKSGSAVTLAWSANNVTACTAGGAWSGSKAVSGTQSTSTLTANATYSLTCTGSGGSATQAATVSITSAAPAPTVTFTANPSTVASGHSSTLTWSSTSATACTASGGWSGAKAINGSQATAPLTANATYTLSCTGTGGTAAQSATVTVSAQAPTVSLKVSPSTVTTGKAATLSWSSTNATTCVASQAWSGNEPMTGSQSTGNLTSNATYILTCTGSGGSAVQSTTVTVTTPAPTVTLTASSTTVASGGKSTLTWSSTNATSCVASGGWSGTIAPTGTQSTTALSAATKYTATCTGAGGSATQSVTVSVAAATPALSFSANPSSIASGNSTTLSWSSTNATACTASGGWTGSQAMSGSKTTGALSANQTYMLNCTGPGGSATQSVSVAVNTPAAPTTPATASCTGTSGALKLNANVVRGTGISPFLVFFDATGTTDSSLTGNTNAFQDVSYSWNFGDNNASGTDAWEYGSNKGHNSRNSATGGVAAHLYLTPGVDTAYTVTVTARNATSTASCQLEVTAYDPAGSNGFAGTKTTCVSASGTPTPGSGGCPAGAAALSTSSFNTALSGSLSNKRVLFKCGDTFTGDNATLTGTKWSIGAYGGCENSQSGRPIIRDSGSTGQFTPTGGGDGRIADLDFEGNGSAGYAVETFGGVITYQMTLYNLLSSGNKESYAYSQGAQWGILNSVQTNATNIGTFMNYGENNPPYTGNVINNLDYQALMGSSISGVGCCGAGSGIETVRISACRLCVIENNTIENANNVGAVLKLHNGNTNNSLPTWTGVYTELIEISDNLFTGNSGSNLVEISPQNAGDDERMRNIIVERNLFSAAPQDGRQLLVSAVNVAVRDNVLFFGAGLSDVPFAGVQVARRGIEPTPSAVEVYNNTCYFLTDESGQYCVGFDGNNFSAPGINSFAKNNLLFTVGSGHPTVLNNGSGNTVSNNTAATNSNPAFTNGSGTFSLISDFKPTASFSGAMTVPLWSDALGVQWSPTWDLGAVHP
jgi:trimeric autotransporter adhesin